MTMGHRIAVLAPLAEAGDSNLMQVGTPLELYDTPRNVFVARFIGAPSMAIMEADLTGRSVTHPACAPFDLPAKWVVPAGETPRKILFGLRPEDVKIAGTGSFSNATRFKGEVEMVETLGHEVLVHVGLGDVTLIAKSFGNMNVPELGDAIELEANLDKLHVFDALTSLRLDVQG